MVFNNKELLLDNFREVLNGYSLDVQDVVRSAILDGKDISMYISFCKNCPYRLDQIRLGMKEGVSSAFFDIKSGNLLYRVRQLLHDKRGAGLEDIVRKGTLSEENLDTIVSWAEKDYDIKGLDISIIPKSMLSSFAYGLSKGFDMKIFNNGRVYSDDYIRLCINLSENGKDPKDFIEGTIWDIDVMKLLVGYSKSADKKKWAKLMSAITIKTSKGKVRQLIQCVNNSISITEICGDEWEEEAIAVILKAFSEGLNCIDLIIAGPSNERVLAKYNELALRKTKQSRVGGKLKKG